MTGKVRSVEVRPADSFPGGWWVTLDDDPERSSAEFGEVAAVREALEVVEGWLDELLPVAITRRVCGVRNGEPFERYVMVERFATVEDAEAFGQSLADPEEYSIDVEE